MLWLYTPAELEPNNNSVSTIRIVQPCNHDDIWLVYVTYAAYVYVTVSTYSIFYNIGRSTLFVIQYIICKIHATINWNGVAVHLKGTS